MQTAILLSSFVNILEDIYGILVPVLQETFSAMVPLLVVALGGLLSEKSGIVNIALEGIMLIGAFVGTLTIYFLEGGSMDPQLLLLLALLLAGLSGMIFSGTHAFASINMKADQTISGTALNIFAPAFTILLARALMTGGKQEIPFRTVFKIFHVPFLSDIPLIGDIFFKNFYLTFYIALAILLIVSFILKRTKLGLRIRASGENPSAADAVGINIYRVRYFGVLASGVLAGMGGLMFIISTSNNYNSTVSGYGFLAVAVLIFGNWKPRRVLFAAFFFGLMKIIGAVYTTIPFLKVLNLPIEFYNALPFIATLVVLAISSKSSNAPKASGIIYDKGAR